MARSRYSRDMPCARFCWVVVSGAKFLAPSQSARDPALAPQERSASEPHRELAGKAACLACAPGGRHRHRLMSRTALLCSLPCCSCSPRPAGAQRTARRGPIAALPPGLCSTPARMTQGTTRPSPASAGQRARHAGYWQHDTARRRRIEPRRGDARARRRGRADRRRADRRWRHRGDGRRESAGRRIEGGRGRLGTDDLCGGARQLRLLRHVDRGLLLRRRCRDDAEDRDLHRGQGLRLRHHGRLLPLRLGGRGGERQPSCRLRRRRGRGADRRFRFSQGRGADRRLRRGEGRGGGRGRSRPDHLRAGER